MQDVPWLPIVAFLVAWLATDRLLPWVGRFAQHLGCFDPPGERKVHREPIPRLGGVAIACGLALALGAIELLSPGAIAPGSAPLRGLLAGASVVFLLGLADDLRPLPARLKLGVQAIAAAMAIGLGLPGASAWPMWAMPLAWVWLVGVTNAINLVDGLDGLAGTLSLVAAAALALLAWSAGLTASGLLAVAVLGALAGFLRYNWHPARIFMGDSGSLLLGFSLAALSLVWLSEAPQPALLTPLLLLGVPLLDTAMAMVRRARARRPIFAPDRAHLHHRLLASGGCQRRAVVTLGAAAALGAGAALRLEGLPAGVPVIGAALVLLLALLWSHARRPAPSAPESAAPVPDILEVH